MPRGPETERMHNDRMISGFYQTYMSGRGLDIGYKGSTVDAIPVLPAATGVDLGFPGYDGLNLPFDSESQDYVYTSHVLEHINQCYVAFAEWFRVIKVGGYLITTVPHMYLYEKKAMLPSRFNEDHKMFFTPARLLQLVEASLAPNTYRVRLLQDNDKDFDYSIPPETHSNGAYEIVLVIQKIQAPKWLIS